MNQAILSSGLNIALIAWSSLMVALVLITER